MSSPPSKPLLRWVVGGTIPQGMNVLKESLTRTMNVYGQRFDYMVCYNNTADEDLNFIRRMFPSVELHAQDWMDCPISDNEATTKMEDGTVRTDVYVCGGSLWKLCPARMRPDAHEIVIDNDLVLIKSMPQIEEFLAGDRPLMLKEHSRWFGIYDILFEPGEKYNSGLVGLPPGFDYADKIRKAWRANGSICKLSYADEQGLITYTLRNENPLFVEIEDVIELHQLGGMYKLNGSYCYTRHEFTDKNYGIHFVQSNRNMPHYPWCHYKNGCIKLI